MQYGRENFYPYNSCIRLQIRSFSGGLPVVKPKWIADSVAANKLLSCKCLTSSIELSLFAILLVAVHGLYVVALIAGI